MWNIVHDHAAAADHDRLTVRGTAESPPLSVTERLERIAGVADDLSRELVRDYQDSPTLRAMAEQLRDDATTVLLELKVPHR